MRHIKPINHEMFAVCLLAILLFTSYCYSADYVVNIIGNSVVFFQLDQKELEALPESDRAEIDEALYDYQRYVEAAKYKLEAAHINVIFTSCNKIKISTKGKSTEYLRQKLDKCCGIMFVKNGKKPKILNGVSTDEEIIEDARLYFSTSIP